MSEGDADWLGACPRCGSGKVAADRRRKITCQVCEFVLYLNVASAVAGLVSDGTGKLLFLRRARDPARGKLGLPGGFLDAEETAEEALSREMREETGWKIAPGAWSYFASFPNRYPYRGVVYLTLDLYFTARLETSLSGQPAPEEVEALVWEKPERLDPDMLAFSSTRRAVTAYLQRSDKR